MRVGAKQNDSAPDNAAVAKIKYVDFMACTAAQVRGMGRRNEKKLYTGFCMASCGRHYTEDL